MSDDNTQGENAPEQPSPAHSTAAETGSGDDGTTGSDQGGGGEQDAGDIPPDRLAIDPKSDFFDADKLGRGVGILFKGGRRTNVEEYCVSEGWVRVQAGKTVDRKGRPLTLRLNGPVEAWYEDLGDDAPKRTA